MKKKLKFTAAFKSFSSDWYFEESTFNNLEEYVCMLYGQNNKDINAARSNMFLQKYSSISKVIDLAVLLPCRSVLYLHAQRANYVAKIWKSSNCWLENGEIDWVETVFPDDIEDILVDPEFDMNSNNSDGDDISDVMVMIFLMRNAKVKNNLICLLQTYLFSSYYYILSSQQ